MQWRVTPNKSFKPLAKLARTSGAPRLFAPAFGMLAQKPWSTSRRLTGRYVTTVLQRVTPSVSDYFKRKDLFEPDGLVIGEDLDINARKETSEEYPFLEEFDRSGCYLIFDRIEPPVGESINPIYAGRSNNLSKRLWTHWCDDRGNVISEYHSLYEQGYFAKNLLDEHSYDVLSVEPEAPTCFAIWFVSLERERMLFEHELIYKCKPLMNKA